MSLVPDQLGTDRRIAFRVVFNVRDLGGIACAGGRTVRRGRLIRADGIHRLAGEDLERARALGIRRVIDLRTQGEIDHSGRFPVEAHPVDWHHLPILRRMWSEDDLVATTGAAEFLRDRYLDMLSEGADSLAEIIGLVSDGVPTLFHCAAGKDRTGVVAAILLGLLGVSAEDIAADYHLTAAAMGDFVDWITLEHPEAVDAMTNQPPEYLEAPAEAMAGFLEAVADRHGSIEGLAGHLGVSPASIDRFRAAALD